MPKELKPRHTNALVALLALYSRPDDDFGENEEEPVDHEEEQGEPVEDEDEQEEPVDDDDDVVEEHPVDNEEEQEQPGDNEDDVVEDEPMDDVVEEERVDPKQEIESDNEMEEDLVEDEEDEEEQEEPKHISVLEYLRALKREKEEKEREAMERERERKEAAEQKRWLAAQLGSSHGNSNLLGTSSSYNVRREIKREVKREMQLDTEQQPNRGSASVVLQQMHASTERGWLPAAGQGSSSGVSNMPGNLAMGKREPKQEIESDNEMEEDLVEDEEDEEEQEELRHDVWPAAQHGLRNGIEQHVDAGSDDDDVAMDQLVPEEEMLVDGEEFHHEAPENHIQGDIDPVEPREQLDDIPPAPPVQAPINQPAGAVFYQNAHVPAAPILGQIQQPVAPPQSRQPSTPLATTPPQVAPPRRFSARIRDRINSQVPLVQQPVPRVLRPRAPRRQAPRVTRQQSRRPARPPPARAQNRQLDQLRPGDLLTEAQVAQIIASTVVEFRDVFLADAEVDALMARNRRGRARNQRAAPQQDLRRSERLRARQTN